MRLHARPTGLFCLCFTILGLASASASEPDHRTLSTETDSSAYRHIQNTTTPPLLVLTEDDRLDLGVVAEAHPRLFIRNKGLRNQYIVVFKPDATDDQIAAHYNWVAKETSITGFGLRQRIFRRFHRILHAYSGTFSKDLALKIASQSAVDYIESDMVFQISDIQDDAPYNLARLSHRNTLTASDVSVYLYDENPGFGATVYVIDTGVYVDHEEFAPNRASFVNLLGGSATKDGNGHGTHVSATAVGNTYGVAKNASVVGVKVMSDRGFGSMSNIIAGLEYVANQHAQVGGPSIINMSLGGIRSSTLNAAARNVVNQGIHVVAAAGNTATNTCSSSPAGEPTVFAVGASDRTDRVAMFSNVGPCTDIFAPGVEIRSAWITSPSSSRVLSGTSMASPLVAGLAAYLAAKNPSASVAEIQSEMIDLATKDMLTNIRPGTPNQLAFNGFDEE
ncbi:peptidase S8/S53 domain-containing protein [Lipomyces arxii]|uniref:peptidase S8/S53 domain-containing protein n=1 Tax=Lipomyces arxii TaxID=56418 RepID=UPI0034CE65AC